ncbi:MAG TPA: hypothetical protein EYP85_13180, partial [Armatimonadetes bacterium]|nr:hypothetical protein [Armatimonadota bacterium]
MPPSRRPIGRLVGYVLLLALAFTGAVISRALDFGQVPEEMIRRGVTSFLTGLAAGLAWGLGLGWLSTARLRAGMLLSAIVLGGLTGAALGFLFGGRDGLSCA